MDYTRARSIGKTRSEKINNNDKKNWPLKLAKGQNLVDKM